MVRSLGSLVLFAAVGMAFAAQDAPSDLPKEKNAPGFFDDIFKQLFGGGKDPANIEKKAEKKAAKDPQDPEPIAKEPVKEPAKEPEASSEKPDEIIQRLKKNFNTTEERLDKKDPGKDTVKLQEQIIDDIDKLLKQQRITTPVAEGVVVAVVVVVVVVAVEIATRETRVEVDAGELTRQPPFEKLTFRLG